MKSFIKVKLDENHCYECSGEILARQNENKATALKIYLTEEMLEKWIYIEFTKPDGTKVSTPKLEVNKESKQVIYEITNALTDKIGEIRVEIVIRDANNLIWKTYTKKYSIVEAINAAQIIEKENPDFITEAQKLMDQVHTLNIEAEKNGKTTKIEITKKNGETDIIEICDGEKGDSPVKGVDYWTEEEVAAIKKQCTDYIDEKITQTIGGEY